MDAEDVLALLPEGTEVTAKVTARPYPVRSEYARWTVTVDDRVAYGNSLDEAMIVLLRGFIRG